MLGHWYSGLRKCLADFGCFDLIQIQLFNKVLMAVGTKKIPYISSS